ncbi:MAG TPA: hypothetical protein VMV69_14245 [Pirellulales bacterium]|nr:hypothetical protein [Pirellulales bacterium]
MNADIEPEVEVPDELRAQQAALRKGEKPRAKVRELLSWFDAARRGFVVVRRVRAALDAVDLVTLPDFEGEYIDQEVFFMDKLTSLRVARMEKNRRIYGLAGTGSDDHTALRPSFVRKLSSG